MNIVVREPGYVPRPGMEESPAPGTGRKWGKRAVALSALMIVGVVAAVAAVALSGGQSVQDDSSVKSKESPGSAGASDTGSTNTPSTSVPPGWPSSKPTAWPSSAPTWSDRPIEPSVAPTFSPTPTSDKPPSPPSRPPTDQSYFPTTAPSRSPSTSAPSTSPSSSPTTSKPTDSPTSKPTDAPSSKPTDAPSAWPTRSPAPDPTGKPTNSPTRKPTDSPTNKPTDSPTNKPTDSPTNKPTGSPTKRPTGSPTVEPDTCVSAFPFHKFPLPVPGCVSLIDALHETAHTALDALHSAIHFLDQYCEHEHHELSGVERDSMKASTTLVKEVLGQMSGTALRAGNLANTLLEHKSNVCVGSFSGEEIIGGPSAGSSSAMLHYGGCSQIPLDPNGEYSVFSFSIPAIVATPLCPVHLTQYGHTMAGCVVVGNCGKGKPVVGFAINKGVATCAAGSAPLALAIAAPAAVAGGVAAAASCYVPALVCAAPMIAVLPSLGVVATTPLGGAAAFGFSPSGKGLQSSIEIWAGVGKPLKTVVTKANVATAKQLSLDTSYLFPVVPYVRLEANAQNLFSIVGDGAHEAVLDLVHNDHTSHFASDILELLTKDVMVSARGDINLEMGLSSLIPWFPKINIPLKDAHMLATLAPKADSGVARGVYVTVRDNMAAAQAVQSLVRPLLRCFGEIIRKICGVSAEDLIANGNFNDVHALFAVTSNGQSTGFRVELPLLTSIFDNAPFDLLDDQDAGMFILECEVKYATKNLQCQFDVQGSTFGAHFVTIVQQGHLILVHLCDHLFNFADNGADVLIAVATEAIGQFHECTIGLLDGDLDDCLIFTPPLIQQTAQHILDHISDFADTLADWANGSGLAWCGLSNVKDAVKCGSHKVVSAALCGVAHIPDALHCGVDFVEDAVHCGVSHIADAAHCGVDVITSAPKCGVDAVTSAIECGWDHFECGTQLVTSGAICGVDFIADAAHCGTTQVVNAALCGTEFVTDAARCGTQTVSSIVKCGLTFVGCIFGGCAAECDVPLSCDAAKTCSIAKKCNVPRTCPQPKMCDKPATCNKPKSCDIPKTCDVPNKCDVPRVCDVAKECWDANTCPLPNDCSAPGHHLL